MMAVESGNLRYPVMVYNDVVVIFMEPQESIKYTGATLRPGRPGFNSRQG